ncbi:hypothetical protein Pmani_001743 [Petrolisthes manimaculis]|uniref:Uncharacterized protein n=1 Tax=Petrolisthes manimaculis TaxID=1843537 RepID=A0AAE1QJG2_9EUCA|nr:hypothetical protein Pmani_001743 [Petrolisthes manimaculis]
MDNVNINNVSEIIKTSYETINRVAKMCPNPESGRRNEWDMSEPRWKQILDSEDPKLIWKSINWKGGITQENEKKPEDDQFKYHF